MKKESGQLSSGHKTTTYPQVVGGTSDYLYMHARSLCSTTTSRIFIFPLKLNMKLNIHHRTM